MKIRLKPLKEIFQETELKNKLGEYNKQCKLSEERNYVTVCHGDITHKLGEKCDFCEKVEREWEKVDKIKLLEVEE